ncbi:very long chain fatty acid elongase AAEL008004-like [Haemaphysalis longicornis]
MELVLSPSRLWGEIYERGDPRTKDYPLVLNPCFVFPLLASYLYFVKVAGPRWMEKRKPFNIINLIRFHNAFLVVTSVVFLYILLKMTYLPGGRYSLWCQGVTGYMDEEMTGYYKYGWIFIAARYADLMDTVFFVLRKKFTHITHLHVIHHTMVTVNVWFFGLYAPEGQPALGLAVNCFVHIIMYSYYLLATMGPAVRKYLWWKKYLTRLQIIQFIFGIAHMAIPLFVDCGFPRHLILISIPQGFLILCLFINFYIKAYRSRNTARNEIPSMGSCNGTPLKKD